MLLMLFINLLLFLCGFDFVGHILKEVSRSIYYNIGLFHLIMFDTLVIKFAHLIMVIFFSLKYFKIMMKLHSMFIII